VIDGQERSVSSEEVSSEMNGVEEVMEQMEVVAEAEDVESLKGLLDEERAKADKYLANWQRAEADLANYKKRSEQERNEVSNFGNTMLILKLLPVLDDLERAMDSISPKLAELTWVDGIRLIYHKLQATLEAQGISPIKALGEAFDPNFHEAVMEREGEEGKVVEEIQKGYKLHDRVIRPTMVIVGKGKEEKEQREQEE
jgi:molecular chaperone GrpE